jgi:glutamate racemase
MSAEPARSAAARNMNAPIAVFDSGVGGLTVVGALRRDLPAESVVYLGDTARVPYGGKSQKTIERYSEEIARLLVEEGAKMVVVACNTASALALDHLRRILPVPVEGVIEPGVQAALAATRTGHVAVIGTKATIGSGAYERGLRAARPDIRVTAIACPLLVPLIEEGMFDDEVTDAVLRRYFSPLKGTDADTIVLGCTHYPLLAPAIKRAFGPEVALVDSAANCAAVVARHLSSLGMLASRGTGSLALGFTDPPDRFLQVAGRVLGLATAPATLKVVPPLGG